MKKKINLFPFCFYLRAKLNWLGVIDTKQLRDFMIGAKVRMYWAGIIILLGFLYSTISYLTRFIFVVMTSNAPDQQMTPWSPPPLTKSAVIEFVHSKVVGVPNSWIQPYGEKTLWPHTKNGLAWVKWLGSWRLLKQEKYGPSEFFVILRLLKKCNKK